MIKMDQSHLGGKLIQRGDKAGEIDEEMEKFKISKY
jgi:hypothetical protein